MMQPYSIESIDPNGWLTGQFLAVPLHRHQQTAELLWVDSGTVDVELTDQRLTLSSGELLLLPAGCWHRLAFADGKPHIQQLIFASIDGAASVQRARPDSPRFIGSLFAELERESLTGVSASAKEQKMLELLLLELDGAFVAGNGNRVSPPCFVQLLHELEETCHLPFSLTDTAARAGLSKFHFSRKFKELYEKTPLQFVIACRMDRAQQLLHTSHLDVPSIAAQCGYKSVTQFHAAFTRYSGITPKRYRMHLADHL